MSLATPTVEQLVERFGCTREEAVDVMQEVAEQRASDVAEGLPVCSRCGCTQNAACMGGCGWHQILPEPICTSCVPFTS